MVLQDMWLWQSFMRSVYNIKKAHELFVKHAPGGSAGGPAEWIRWYPQQDTTLYHFVSKTTPELLPKDSRTVIIVGHRDDLPQKSPILDSGKFMQQSLDITNPNSNTSYVNYHTPFINITSRSGDMNAMPSSSSESYDLNEFTEHVNAKIDTLTAVVQKLVESKKEAVRSVVTSPAECCTPSLRSIYSWDEFFKIGAPYNTYAVYEAPYTTYAVYEAPYNTYAVYEAPYNTYAVYEAPYNTYAVYEAPYNTYAVYEDNRVYYTGCPKTRRKGYPVSVLTRLPNGNKTPAFTRILHHIKVHTRSAYHIQNTNSPIKLERKEQDVGLNLCLMTMCFISRISYHFSSKNMIRH